MYSFYFLAQKDKLLYLHGPIGITLLSNLLMFIYNAIMIIVKYLRYAEVPSDPRNNLNDNVKKQRSVFTIRWCDFRKLKKGGAQKC